MFQLVPNLDVLVTILIFQYIIGSILLLVGSKWLLGREARMMISGAIDELFGKPATKRAMSIMGTESGEVRHDAAVVESMAKDFLNNPQMKGAKMIAKQMGFDIDEYIEEHGASDTIEGIQSLGQLAGIDVMAILRNPSAFLETLNKEGSPGESTGKNPYL